MFFVTHHGTVICWGPSGGLVHLPPHEIVDAAAVVQIDSPPRDEGDRRSRGQVIKGALLPNHTVHLLQGEQTAALSTEHGFLCAVPGVAEIAGGRHAILEWETFTCHEWAEAGAILPDGILGAVQRPSVSLGVVPVIRVAMHGNVGNTLFMFLSAHKIAPAMGEPLIANVSLSMFGINQADVNTQSMRAMHIAADTEHRTRGLINTRFIERAYAGWPFDLLQIEGYCQNVNNLPCRDQFDYDRLLPSPFWARSTGGRDDELVISIRGAEILDAIHPHYTLLPFEFYDHLIRTTKLQPVFFGQLGDNEYVRELRRRFPTAVFRSGTSAAADFDFLRKSRNIVSSISTFAWMAGWLSHANRIIVPLSGLFHPNQNKCAWFLPEDDPRFEYYLFPFNYAVPVSRFTDSDHAMQGRWRRLSGEDIRVFFLTRSEHTYDLVSYLDVFDPDDYATMYPDQQMNRDLHGTCALFDHYVQHGFKDGRNPCRIDRAWYCLNYPDAAVALGENRYRDEIHHYIAYGRHHGYRARP